MHQKEGLGNATEGKMVVNGEFSRSFGRVPLKNVTAFAWIAAASTLTTTTVTHRSRFKKEHRHATTSSRKKVSGGRESEEWEEASKLELHYWEPR
jgi:hypothetical protein